MDIQVPRSDPTAFERAFCSKHEALGLKTTAGSGSKWGDGDAREVLDRGKLQFALEAKCRFTESDAHPKPKEWEKAMSQLRKRDPDAIRLFAVYVAEKEHVPISSYAVSIPAEDITALGEVVSVPEFTTFTISRGEKTWECGFFVFSYWKDLYESIKSHRSEDQA